MSPKPSAPRIPLAQAFDDTANMGRSGGRQGLGFLAQFAVSSNNLSPTHGENHMMRGHHREGGEE
jgi:hypothetical protein